MNRGLRRPPPAIAAAVGLALALAALAGIAVLQPFGPRTGGPLAQRDVYAVSVPLPRGEAGTRGSVLPPNQTGLPITIESVELVDPVGLEVLGVFVNVPENDGAIGFVSGFSPTDWNGVAPAGAVLPGIVGGQSHLQVLVGVRRTGTVDGTIAGIRVRYRHDSVEYEDVLPFPLRVFEP